VPVGFRVAPLFGGHALALVVIPDPGRVAEVAQDVCRRGRVPADLAGRTPDAALQQFPAKRLQPASPRSPISRSVAMFSGTGLWTFSGLPSGTGWAPFHIAGEAVHVRKDDGVGFARLDAPHRLSDRGPVEVCSAVALVV
jgi:hypothetical protein